MEGKLKASQVSTEDDALSQKVTDNAFSAVLKFVKFRKITQTVMSRSIALNLILGYSLATSVTVNVYLGWQAVNREREYFAADNGRFLPLISMSKPYRKASEIIQFARDTVNQSFALDFLNYQGQLENVRSRYTKNGFRSFIESLQASGLLGSVKEKRMAITITAGTGVLSQEGVENGTYVWIVEMPIEVKLAGQTSELTQRFKAVVRVERTSTLDSIEGISVEQLITSPI